MQKITSTLFLLFFSVVFLVNSQNAIIELPHNKPDDIIWVNPEKEYTPELWGNSPAISNVSKPELIVYKPPIEKQNGISVIIAPGGGMYALSIRYEGRDVAKWLNSKGITAFILKYRLMPTGEDASRDFAEIIKSNNKKRVESTKKLMPYATEDGLNAISYVREHAKALGVASNKIGFMGFSAGGCVLFGVVNSCTESNKPNFLVPIYPGTDLIDPKPNQFTPPTLFITAADDEAIDPTLITSFFDKWHRAGIKTSLHLYDTGGHGFGTWKKELPVSNWLDRFYEWVTSKEIFETK